MAFSNTYLVLLGFLLMWSMPRSGIPIRGNMMPISRTNLYKSPFAGERIIIIHLFWGRSGKKTGLQDHHFLDNKKGIISQPHTSDDNCDSSF